MAQLETSERRAVNGLRDAIAAIRQVDPDMAMQTLHAYLEVATNPGVTMLDLQKKLGVSSAAMSRIISRLSEWERHDVPGLNWVIAEKNILDRRYMVVNLTPKGATMARKIKGLI